MQKENSEFNDKEELLSGVGIHNSFIASATWILYCIFIPAQRKTNCEKKLEKMDS